MTPAGMLATGRSGLDPQLIPDAAHDQPRSLPVFIELAPFFSRALSLTNHEGLGTVGHFPEAQTCAHSPTPVEGRPQHRGD